jgi:threonine dehydrogenase-like Zn-dependent dehydrogenase
MIGVVFLGDKQVENREFSTPEPSEDQVLVRMEATTICGSDMHYYRSSAKDLSDRLGLIGGHEVAGTIERMGGCVTGLNVGDRVSVFHLYGCGNCEMCRKGYPQYCLVPGAASGLVRGQLSSPWRSSGTFADYVITPASTCFKLPASMDYLDGAILGCSAITAYQIIEKLGIAAGDFVAVYGLGPVGMCATIILKALSAHVVGVDLSPGRSALASKFGAGEVVNASSANCVEEVVSLSYGGRGVDAAIDFSGNPTAVMNAIRSVKVLGKVGLVGVGPRISEQFISPSTFATRGVWITGISVSNANLWYDLVRLMTTKNVSFAPVVTEKYSLNDSAKAFEAFDTLQTGKVALLPRT